MIKGSIQEEDITIVNIYVPNIGAPQYIRQTLTDIKGEKDSSTINDILEEVDLIDIFRTFHPNAEEYTFSSANGTFSRIDHVLGHKSNLSKFKKIEFISSIFSNHNAIKTIYQLQEKKNCKKQKHMEIKQHVSN